MLLCGMTRLTTKIQYSSNSLDDWRNIAITLTENCDPWVNECKRLVSSTTQE